MVALTHLFNAGLGGKENTTVLGVEAHGTG